MKRAILAITATVLFVPGSLFAQLDFGAQGSWGENSDFGVGGRLVVGLPISPGLELTGAFDYFFPEEEGVDYWELNANLAYKIPNPSPLSPYLGVGVNVAHLAVERTLGNEVFDESDSEVGLNVLGGARLNIGSIMPFAEARYELGGGEQFVASVGLLFNVGPGLTVAP